MALGFSFEKNFTQQNHDWTLWMILLNYGTDAGVPAWARSWITATLPFSNQ
jgi:hypothetical protein